jgi:hypothetical protein
MTTPAQMRRVRAKKPLGGGLSLDLCQMQVSVRILPPTSINLDQLQRRHALQAFTRRHTAGAMRLWVCAYIIVRREAPNDDAAG